MKNEIRKHFKNLRNSLTEKEVKEKSLAILQTLTSYPFWQNAKHIMCYLSFGKEVYTKPIIEEAWKANKQVVIPVCKRETCDIEPSQLFSFADLEPRTMGILEPKEGKLMEVDPKVIDLCLIPGLAFDLMGHRIGFGAGYYDRFLPLLRPDTPKVALAYELQISQEPLPSEYFDVLMDYICTEKGLYQSTTLLQEI
jgi:5-formyltetrahydrofolate cyclo-ligase